MHEHLPACGYHRTFSGAIPRMLSFFLTPFSFNTRLLLGLELAWVEYTGWLASPRDLPISSSQCWDYKHSLPYSVFFSWVLGIRCRSLSLLSYLPNPGLCFVFLLALFFFSDGSNVIQTRFDSLRKLEWPTLYFWSSCLYFLSSLYVLPYIARFIFNTVLIRVLKKIRTHKMYRL